MKKLNLLICVALLSACATPTPIPQDIKDKVALIPLEDLPKNSALEKTHCPKHLNPTFDKKRECKISLRRELAAKEMMRQQKEQTEQNTTKEESDETIEN